MDGYTGTATNLLDKSEVIVIKEILRKNKNNYKPVYPDGLLPILTTETDINYFLFILYPDEEELTKIHEELKKLIILYNIIKVNSKVQTKFIEKYVLWLLGQKMLDKS